MLSPKNSRLLAKIKQIAIFKNDINIIKKIEKIKNDNEITKEILDYK